MRRSLIILSLGFSSLFADNTYNQWESEPNQSSCPACRRASTYRKQAGQYNYQPKTIQSTPINQQSGQNLPSDNTFQQGAPNQSNPRMQGQPLQNRSNNPNAQTQWEPSNSQYMTPSQAYYQKKRNPSGYTSFNDNPDSERFVEPQTQTARDLNSGDLAIQSKIRALFDSGILTPDFANVIFTVNNGTVTLRGAVSTHSDRSKLEQKIRAINGVRGVNNMLEVTQQKTAMIVNAANIDDSTAAEYASDFGTTDFDKKLNRRIRESLTNLTFARPYNSITLNTTRGVVTVSGALNTVQERDQLIARIRNVDGVRAIINQVAVSNKSVGKYNI